MKKEDLTARLAELSDSIKAKTGKAAREEAEAACNGVVEKEKTRLTSEFTVWLHREILESLPTETQLVWRNYLASVEAVRAHLDPIGPRESANQWNGRRYRHNHASEELFVIEFPQFVTGQRFSSGWESGMAVLSKKVRGYEQRKKLLEAKIADLNAIKAQTSRAIWRTYKSRTAVTSNGVELATAVKELVSAAIGVPLLAAPTVEAEVC